ncbi:MAG TPA: phosphoenolpyruvate-utilizing N-terminal domain-containing protein, partial [Tepidisphaeraceae bacterium]
MIVPPDSERIIHGVVVSAGIASGHAVRAFDPLFISFNLRLQPEQVADEVARFRASVEESYRQLKNMQDILKRRQARDSSFLIEAHILILRDRLFVDRIVEKIESEQINAEWAIQQISDELFTAYDHLEDDYLRERRGDLEDIVRRLLHNLHAEKQPEIRKLPFDAILIAKAIPPSTLFELRSQRVAGLVTETGTPLSHTAIMARSLEMPAVMGTSDLSSIAAGDFLIVDGDAGIVICSPSEEQIQKYKDRFARRPRAGRRTRIAPKPSETADKVHISLAANINFKEEVDAVVASGCESVGLYRTEFDFFHEGKTPDEGFLLDGYMQVLQHAEGRPVTFRTIDVGIDQKTWDGAHPGLGARGLRFCLENRDLFR